MGINVDSGYRVKVCRFDNIMLWLAEGFEVVFR